MFVLANFRLQISRHYLFMNVYEKSETIISEIIIISLNISTIAMAEISVGVTNIFFWLPTLIN